MVKDKALFEVFNSNANNANIKKLIHNLDKTTLAELNKELTEDEFLCICSGGTTSNCARENFITVDLRKNYSQITYDEQTERVNIGGGVLMGDLLNYLEKFERTFPIGLSQLPGAGYILTGGVSPLSRRYGLAIDNMISVEGYFGNGDYFSLNKKNLKEEENLIWQAIKGAAPFFSIVTEIGLKTFKSYPILIFEGFVEVNELKELIIIAENFPESMSLQWIFSDKIYIYIVAELREYTDIQMVEKYTNDFKKFTSLTKKNYKSFKNITFFPKELNLYQLNSNYHSEVISLLGGNLYKNAQEFIKVLCDINLTKPNKSCYLAAQQFGMASPKNDYDSSFFVNRESSWKPWIYGSWDKDNIEEKTIVLGWMYKSWSKLKRFFPHIHLAQIHNHLNSHHEEINLAYGHKLDDLKRLKNFYDPLNILPPL